VGPIPDRRSIRRSFIAVSSRTTWRFFAPPIIHSRRNTLICSRRVPHPHSRFSLDPLHWSRHSDPRVSLSISIPMCRRSGPFSTLSFQSRFPRVGLDPDPLFSRSIPSFSFASSTPFSHISYVLFSVCRSVPISTFVVSFDPRVRVVDAVVVVLVQSSVPFVERTSPRVLSVTPILGWVRVYYCSRPGKIRALYRDRASILDLNLDGEINRWSKWD